MAGRVLRVVPKTHYVLSTSDKNSVEQEIFVAEHIDVSNFRENVIYVRLHEKSTVSSTGWTQAPLIRCYIDGYTTEDSNWNQFFVSPNANTVSLPFVTSSSAMVAFALPSNLGGLITLTLAAKASGAATCDIWLSIDLSGKE